MSDSSVNARFRLLMTVIWRSGYGAKTMRATVSQATHYAIAVTIETETPIPVYAEIRQRLRVRPRPAA
jgi:hypothetical protein